MSYKANTGHPHATPNFRNLLIRPMWMTLKTALRTVPFVGKARFLKNDYHGQPTVMIDQTRWKGSDRSIRAPVRSSLLTGRPARSCRSSSVRSR